MKKDLFDDIVVVKRSGQRVNFNGTKIAIAIKLAFDDTYETYDEKDVNLVYTDVINTILKDYENRKTISVEDIQDLIEKVLLIHKFDKVHENFNSYRLKRKASRETFKDKETHKFNKIIEGITSSIQNNSNKKIYPSLVSYGTSILKEYSKSYLIDNKNLRLHDDGSIYIHNLDVYACGTIGSYHIDLKDIKSDNLYEYTSIIKDILINIKKETYGNINICNIDKLYSVILINNFKALLKRKIYDYLKLDGFEEYFNFKKVYETIDKINTTNIDNKYFEQFLNNERIRYIFDNAIEDTKFEINEILNICIDDLLTSLNNVVFYLKCNKYSVSININGNYDELIVSDEITDYILTHDYLDNVSIIYKINKYNDKLLDLINKNIYILNTNEENLEYFIDGSRVYENYWQENTSLGKMTLSTVTINLPRIGITSNNKNEYFKKLKDLLDTAKNTLMQHFELISNNYKDHYEYLFNNEIFQSIDLEENQKIRKIIKNGVLQIGFVGLYESVIALNKNFDETFAKEVLKFMKDTIDTYKEEEKLNFVLYATNNISILENLIKIDKSVFGNILNVTDKKMYYQGCKIPDEEFDYSVYEKYITGGSVVEIEIPRKASNKKIVELINTAIDEKINFFTFRGYS